MKLYTIAEVKRLRQDSQDLPYLTEIANWIEMFLAKPHPELGRTGAVCPFVPRSIRLNTIWLAVIRTKNSEQRDIEAIVQQYQEAFLQLAPQSGEHSLYKAIMLIFPDVTDREIPTLINEVQQKLKPGFVEKGLMVGEFYQHNASPGLHNPDFRPLRSPIPMLAVRFMVESDLPFLSRLTDEPGLRVGYLESYLNQLDGTIKDETRLFGAQNALAFAQRQLHRGDRPPARLSRKCPFAVLPAVLTKPFVQLKKIFART